MKKLLLKKRFHTARKQHSKDLDLDYDGSTPISEIRQELFCTLYTSMRHGCFGNGQESYLRAYGKIQRIYELKEQQTIKPSKKLHKEILTIKNAAASCATKLLLTAKILARVNYLIDELGKDEILDRAALEVVAQNKDPHARMRAIERFDKIRGRIIEKSEVKHQFEKIDSFVIIEEPAK